MRNKTEIVKECYKHFVKDTYTDKIYFLSNKNLSDKEIRKNQLEFICDISYYAIFAFMVSTKFRYKNLDDIFNSKEIYKIKNDQKTAKELFLLFLSDIFINKKYHKFKNFNEKFILNLLKSKNYKINVENFIEIFYNSRILKNKEDLFFNDEKLKEYIKIYGTSSTDISVVKNMIDKIDINDKTILDPCCGRGIFLFYIKQKNKNAKITGYDCYKPLCYLAQSIIDYEEEFEPVIEYKNFLVNDGDSMKFDVIIGNPPYNRGLIKRNSNLFNHVAMDFSKSGHIGFLIEGLKHLSDDGVLEFITPAKFFMDVNSVNTREFLFENYCVEEINYYECKDVFPGVGVSLISVFKIKNGKTDKIKVKYDNTEYFVKPFEYNNFIVPKFDNILWLSIYEKMSNKNLFFPKFVNYNLRDDHKKYGKYYSLEQDNYYKNKTLIELNNKKEIYGYSCLTTNNNFWRCVAKEMSIDFYITLSPNIETNYTFYSIPCISKEQSDNIVKYVQTILYKKIKEYFRISLNSQCWLNNIPMVNFDFDTEEDLYDYFDFNEEEKEFLTKEVI